MRHILILLALCCTAWALTPEEEVAACQAKIDSLNTILANSGKAEATRAQVQDSLNACGVCGVGGLKIIAEKDSLDYMYVRLRFGTQSSVPWELLAQGSMQEFVADQGVLVWDRVIRTRRDRAWGGIARLKQLSP